VQFVDDARALINGGNFHRFNILNQYLYSEIIKLPWRGWFLCFIIFNMFLDV
jgi:hypothetical protein